MVNNMWPLWLRGGVTTLNVGHAIIPFIEVICFQHLTTIPTYHSQFVQIEIKYRKIINTKIPIEKCLL